MVWNSNGQIILKPDNLFSFLIVPLAKTILHMKRVIKDFLGLYKTVQLVTILFQVWFLNGLLYKWKEL